MGISIIFWANIKYCNIYFTYQSTLFVIRAEVVVFSSLNEIYKHFVFSSPLPQFHLSEPNQGSSFHLIRNFQDKYYQVRTELNEQKH